jgi:hypothetical protein
MTDTKMAEYIGTNMVNACPERATNGADGYNILYPDGHKSWAPKISFEEVYRPVNSMTFGHALEALKQGLRVRREGWEEKGRWVQLDRLIPIADIDDSIFSSASMRVCITMKINDKYLSDSRIAQEDVFAEDWQIEEKAS